MVQLQKVIEQNSKPLELDQPLIEAVSDQELEDKFHLVRMKPCSIDRISSILQDAGYKAKIELKKPKR